MVDVIERSFRVAMVPDLKPISQYIKHHIAPFTPGEIVVSVTDTLYDTRVIRVDVSTFPDNPCIIRDPNLWIKMINDGDTESLIYEIGFRAAKHFKAIPALPVGDHITLGDN